MSNYEIKDVKSKLEGFFNSQNIVTDHIDGFVKTWEDNKQDMIALFGGKLSIEKKVETKMNEEDLKASLQGFLERRLFANERTELRKIIRESSYESLIGGTFDVAKKEGFPDKYRKGMKISKAIQLFLKQDLEDPNYTEMNGKWKTRRESIDIHLSKVIQGFKSIGYIGISIHPLDYLTMSLNNNNWSSCHAPGGCYQGGCLSYMMDKVSAVGYFYSGKMHEYDFGNWNSKAWRQMVHFDIEDKVAVFNRQYPRMDDNYTLSLRTLVEMIFEGNQASEEVVANQKWYITTRPSKVGTYTNNIGLHYPDIKHNHDGVSRIRADKDKDLRTIIIGKNPPCVCCGEEMYDSEQISCCGGNRRRCENCGDNHDGDDMIFIDGDYYCDECLQELFFYCDGCGEYMDRDERHNVDGDDLCTDCCERKANYCKECEEWVYSRNFDSNLCICHDCRDGLYTQCEDCDKYVLNDDAEHYEDCDLCKDCLEERKESQTDED